MGVSEILRRRRMNRANGLLSGLDYTGGWENTYHALTDKQYRILHNYAKDLRLPTARLVELYGNRRMMIVEKD